MSRPSSTPYDALFYVYQREGSLRSAAAVLNAVSPILQYRSVLDIGCGAGAWLAAHRDLGITDFVGVDGNYVDRALLLFDQQSFFALNVAEPFDLQRRFDIVQCLEVAEHIPSSASSILIDNIVRHGDLVLFSAAVPGQGGKDHVNEQPYEHWRDMFAARHYRLYDFVRPRIKADYAVEPWYRYNLMLFANDSIADGLPEPVQSTRIGDRAAIPDLSPPMERLRRGLLRCLPAAAVSGLAVLKHRSAVRQLRRRQSA
jgi:SAM-dependent methyltransferase